MKKIILLLMLTFTAPLSYAAQEAEGVIEKLKICGAGLTGPERWSRTLMVKIDGKWFATYADHDGSLKDYDNNISTSVLLMAFSQNLTVAIRATNQWDDGLSKCGIPKGAMFHDHGNDYISIVR